jgi:cell cycle checkpoint protein
MAAADDQAPTFSAVSSSTRQLYLLLRCISFASKAQVQITEEGLRFSAEDSSVMEGSVSPLTLLDAFLLTNS